MRLALFGALFFREALRTLWRNPMRSALTTLGIQIGITGVVLVVAVGQAGSERAQEELRKLGDNLVWIEAGSRNIAGVRTGSHGTTTLTLGDEEAIQRDVAMLKRCSPQVDGGLQLASATRNWTTRYRGASPDYLDVKRWQVVEGAAFTDDDVRQVAGKVLIGRTVRQQLFGADPAVGEVVRAQGQLFQVIGVLGAKGQTPDGRDQDDWVLLPHTTAQSKLRGRGFAYLDDILCSATAPELVNPAIDRVNALMRQRHGIAPGQEDDFNIRRPDEVLKAQIDAADALALMLLAVAAIALVVGGIGIMNVMLASVAQRTHEVGLRAAVGATTAAVMAQFLGEAVMLSLSGGLLGIALSAAGSSLFAQVLGWPISLSARAVALAVASSAAVGICFGFWPAWRAARLDPIEALRHE